MSGQPRRWPVAATWLASAVLIAMVAVGCSTSGASRLGSARPSEPPSSAATLDPAAASVVSAGPSVAPSPSAAQADAPPGASLNAEGGDPVAGQLGSYTWAGGGSDSPWLPGSPIAVGAGEPLAVRLDAAPAVADWSATRVVAGTTDGSGAMSLASAEGEPIRFMAPAAGRWSIQVQVRFGGGSDSAAYYWLLDVR